MCHVKKCRREDENLCWKHVSLERQDVDASFLSTSNLPLSALPGFLDQAKLIFFFQISSTFNIQGNDCEVKSGNFCFHPETDRTLGWEPGTSCPKPTNQCACRCWAQINREIRKLNSEWVGLPQKSTVRWAPCATMAGELIILAEPSLD